MKINYALATFAAGVVLFSAGCSRESKPPEQSQLTTPAPTATTADQNAPAAPGQQPSALTNRPPAAGRTTPQRSQTESRPPAAESRPQAEARPAPTPAPPPAPAVKTVTLASGTPIVVRSTSTLSTKTAETGGTFDATLEKPIVHNGWVVAPRGSRIVGKIVQSDPGGRVKGTASLDVALTSITTADGQRIAVNTSNVSQEAKSTKKKDAAKVGIGAGIGAAIGAIAGGGKGAAIGAGVGGAGGTAAVLGTRGEAAVIPAETVMTFELRSPVTITERSGQASRDQ